MRLLLLLLAFPVFSLSYLKRGAGTLEILIESGAPVHAGFEVTHDNKSQTIWRHLKPNTPELLIFEGFYLEMIDLRLINVTIHDNVTSHSAIFSTRGEKLYDVDELPLPYTGFQMKMKCAEDWYGSVCFSHCSIKGERWRCSSSGSPICAEGYCGLSCHQSGSDCAEAANCSCQNGGICSDHSAFSSAFYCECPPGYHGSKCEIFNTLALTSNFTTNFGANATVKNQFSNRADIYQLFEKFEAKSQMSELRDTQTHQSYETLAVIFALLGLMTISGYCIFKWCGILEMEKEIQKILDNAKKMKKTPEEEINCILIEMNAI